MMVAAGLGAPLPGATHLIDVLLVLTGFNLAHTIMTRADEQGWALPYLAYYAVRIVVPVALVVGLVTLAVALSPLGPGGTHTVALGSPQLRTLAAIATSTLNLVAHFDGVDFAELNHLWLVSLVAQVGLVAPILVVGDRRRIGRDRRALALAAMALLVTVVRTGLLVIGESSAGTLAMLRYDAILAGMALGVMPKAMFHRRPIARAATPALMMLAIIIAGPIDTVIAGGNQRLIDIIGSAVLGPLTIALTVIVVWAEANDRLPHIVTVLLDASALQWLAERGLILYLWSAPFAYLMQDAIDDAVGDWPGLAPFVVSVVLTLAAATICHRLIIEPMLTGLARSAEAAANPASTTETEAAREPAGPGGGGDKSRPTAKPDALQPMQTIKRRPRPVPNPRGERTGRLGRVLPPLPRSSREIEAARAEAQGHNTTRSGSDGGGASSSDGTGYNLSA